MKNYSGKWSERNEPDRRLRIQNYFRLAAAQAGSLPPISNTFLESQKFKCYDKHGGWIRNGIADC